MNARDDVDSSWRQMICFTRMHTQKEKLKLKKELEMPYSVANQQAMHIDYLSSDGKPYL